MLVTDRFAQTMLYARLAYGDEKFIPEDGFKIYEDQTMSYEGRTGGTYEVEIRRVDDKTLEVFASDTKSNECAYSFMMKYEKLDCRICDTQTIHAARDQHWYCSECGTIRDK